MSTYWHLECQDHAPKILSDQGTNHGNKDLAEFLSVWKQIPNHLLNGYPIDVEVKVAGESWPATFMQQHTDCRVMIKSEYGDYYIDGQVYKKESLPA